MGTGDRSRGTAREGTEPNGGGQAPGRGRSTPSGTERGSTLLTDGGTDEGAGLLSPPVVGGLAAVLAIGQLVGLLLVVVEPPHLPDVVNSLRFLYATPLGTLTYYLVVFPDPSTALWAVFSIGYFAAYAAAGWFVLSDGALSTSREGLLKLFFAGNAILYAIAPVVIVRTVNRQFGGRSLVGYYTTNGTIPVVVAYAVLMGVLYVGVGRLSADSGAGEPASGGQPTGSTARRQPRRSDPGRPQGDPAPADAGGGGSTGRTAGDASTGRNGEQGAQRSAARQQQGGSRGNEARQQHAQQGQPQGRNAGRNEPRGQGQPSGTETEGREPGGSEAARQQQPGDGNAGASEPAERAPGGDEPDAKPSSSADRDRGDEGGNELVDLFERLTASDREERLAAAERIGEITWEDPSAVAAEPLAEAIDREPDAEVREALVVAVGSIDSETAEEALREARFDPDPNVSTRASRLLQ